MIAKEVRARIVAHITDDPAVSARTLSTLYGCSYHTARRIKIAHGIHEVKPKKSDRVWTPDEDALLDDDSMNPTDVARHLGITRSMVMCRVRKLRRLHGDPDFPPGWSDVTLNDLSHQCSRGMTVAELGRYFGTSCQSINDGLRFLEMKPRDIFFSPAGTRYMRLNGREIMCDYQGTRL